MRCCQESTGRWGPRSHKPLGQGASEEHLEEAGKPGGGGGGAAGGEQAGGGGREEAGRGNRLGGSGKSNWVTAGLGPETGTVIGDFPANKVDAQRKLAPRHRLNARLSSFLHR